MKQILKSAELDFYEFMIEEERSFYLPQLGIGYLGRSTINQASALAMQFLYFECSGMKSLQLKMPDHFLTLIWLEAISYYGSKIINPKRKTETIRDIKKKIQQSDPRKQDKEALKLALYQKTKELMVLSGRSFVKSPFPIKKKSSYIQCAHLLGSILGEKIYKGYKCRYLSVSFIQILLKKKANLKNFDLFYYEMLETVENLPDAFHSKSDRL
jgi:hypothetical protein